MESTKTSDRTEHVRTRTQPSQTDLTPESQSLVGPFERVREKDRENRSERKTVFQVSRKFLIYYILKI